MIQTTNQISISIYKPQYITIFLWFSYDFHVPNHLVGPEGQDMSTFIFFRATKETKLAHSPSPLWDALCQMSKSWFPAANVQTICMIYVILYLNQLLKT